MTTLELVLGAVAILLAMVVLVLVAGDGEDETEGADAAVETDALRASVGDALRELDLDRNATLIEDHAREMRRLHTDVERLLRTPQQRGGFGEFQLETILEDQLPPDTYGTQEAVVGNKRPDAHVETSAGVVAIDAKFPLEAYERAIETDDPEEQARHEREFAQRVESQLDKIASDYVQPEAGTAPFALAFIPSEAVYYHLLTEEYDLLTEYGDRGVQVVSPLTLGQKLRLIRADVHARQLTERAEAVQAQLETLAGRFDAVADDWDTAMGHLSNAMDRADDADRAFEHLRTEFQRIEGLAAVEDETGDGASGDPPVPNDDGSDDTTADGTNPAADGWVDGDWTDGEGPEDDA